MSKGNMKSDKINIDRIEKEANKHNIDPQNRNLVLTKEEATENLEDCFTLIHDFLDITIKYKDELKNFGKLDDNRIIRMEKLRDRFSILKNKQIIIQ